MIFYVITEDHFRCSILTSLYKRLVLPTSRSTASASKVYHFDSCAVTGVHFEEDVGELQVRVDELVRVHERDLANNATQSTQSV